MIQLKTVKGIVTNYLKPYIGGKKGNEKKIS